jgi:hypothetical protein
MTNPLRKNVVLLRVGQTANRVLLIGSCEITPVSTETGRWSRMDSIPFTRSINYQGLTERCSKSAVKRLRNKNPANLAFSRRNEPRSQQSTPTKIISTSGPLARCGRNPRSGEMLHRLMKFKRKQSPATGLVAPCA